jgi:hypothetical protein
LKRVFLYETVSTLNPTVGMVWTSLAALGESLRV